jgi:hypothetical protein
VALRQPRDLLHESQADRAKLVSYSSVQDSLFQDTDGSKRNGCGCMTVESAEDVLPAVSSLWVYRSCGRLPACRWLGRQVLQQNKDSASISVYETMNSDVLVIFIPSQIL